ncbi:MAG: DUF3795 domain-containing protein [Bifidobacteriaceae bacterium]|jgi:hypothetical protein|nr:DUF3795 domain-containing protein [Bifidobacteriaceae bacterium]
MKSYTRTYPLFSLCGLNCGLCPRYHTKGKSKCPGCGGRAFYEKHPPCGVISCAKRHGGVEYCYLCTECPCKKYYDSEKIKDSFITKQRQLADFRKVQEIGLAAYQAELNEKVGILERLLVDFDDGRRKNFFCIAINLLELADIKDVMAQLEAEVTLDATLKEKAVLAVRMFRQKADEREILLELRKTQ